MKHLFLLSALTLSVFGCARLAVSENMDKLNTAVIHYSEDLHWDRYDDAYRRHIYQDGTQPEFDMEIMEHIDVTAARPVKPVIDNEEATAATIPFTIEYYDERYNTVRTIKQTQKWWFDEEGKNWLIASEFPPFE